MAPRLWLSAGLDPDLLRALVLRLPTA
jgi:hypothetical protein